MLNLLLQKTYQNVIVLFMPEVHESLKKFVYNLIIFSTDNNKKQLVNSFLQQRKLKTYHFH